MSKIRECFDSRFDGGCLMEADYSQLEIICLAYLSGDPQMKEDILNGVDLHRVRASEMFRILEVDVTPQQRQIAKEFSFQLQYGAGAKSMAAGQQGTTEETAKAFIKSYYDRYPMVKSWQEGIAEEFMRNRVPSKRVTQSFKTAGKGWHTSATGRRYVIYEDDNPFYKNGKPSWTRGRPPEPATNFSPTKMKNYPVQGFATGDIVPMMLGEIYKWQVNHGFANDFLLINTVHDSILFDCRYQVGSGETVHFAEHVKRKMEMAPEYLKRYFDINFDIPLKVDIKVGENWGSMKDFKCP